MLERLGRFCARRHRLVLTLWVGAFAGVIGLYSAHHGEQRDTFSIPGTQSQQALDLLQSEFPAANGLVARVVFEVTNGTVDDPATKAAIEQVVGNLRGLDGVSNVVDPFVGTPSGLQFDQGAFTGFTYEQNTISANRQVAYTVVSWSTQLESIGQVAGIFHQVEQAIQPSVQAGITTNIGGQVADIGNRPPPGLSAYSELLGIVVAMVILVLALGSLTSMAVPIGVALVSVFAFSHPVVDILSADFTIGTVAPILGSMIGIGVGIDYSLFIVSRFRQNLSAGMEVEQAVGNAIGTSGSAVLFAGLTVCLALSGLILVGIPYVTNLGLVSAIFVLVTVTAALTLVPAILGALGPRINIGRVHHRDETVDLHATLSARWANETSRHPVIFAVTSFVVLVLLALPVRSMELGFPNDASLPSDLTQHQAYVTLTENFGPGVNGPLVVAIDLPPANQDNAPGLLRAMGELTGALKATAGVASVSMPVPNQMPSSSDPGEIPTAVIVQVTPVTDPMSEQTNQLVKDLRATVIPQALQGTAIPPNQVYVGGQTAMLIDLTDAIQAKLPAFIGGVIAGAFLLLMMVFRSLFVPAKAAVMNLLSIGGAYGIIVVVFQWGWGKELLGLETTVPIVAFVPVMMFAVLFGLSMDYEVFLLSRIREEYARTGESRRSVVNGLAATARVISAAALIMISVFLAFVPNPDPTVKMIGLGMAMAVLIDATIVRMMLVPSTMELAGRANWWLPRWLDRILPRISVE